MPASKAIPKYSPMIPTLVRQPFHRDGWVYEEKVDGWRIIAYKEGTRVRLVSRKGVTHSGRFGEIAAALAAMRPETLVLDGEVAMFDQQLRSRFEQLRHRDPNVVTTPPVLIAFDVLHREGEDLSARPLRERRQILEELLVDTSMIFPARRLAPNGLEAWAQVLERGYEGMVGKDETSPYIGGITRSWLKVKVPGWTDPEDKWRRVRL
jgi:bifunctional non-homologous end joining protein LigD